MVESFFKSAKRRRTYSTKKCRWLRFSWLIEINFACVPTKPVTWILLDRDEHLMDFSLSGKGCNVGLEQVNCSNENYIKLKFNIINYNNGLWIIKINWKTIRMFQFDSCDCYADYCIELTDYVWPVKYIFESPSLASFRNNPGNWIVVREKLLLRVLAGVIMRAVKLRIIKQGVRHYNERY